MSPSLQKEQTGPTWLPVVLKWAKIVAPVVGVGLVALQFTPPEVFLPSLKGAVIGENPEERFDIPAPPEVEAILRRSCYDCHSNETKWPFYSRIAPSSWLVMTDVQNGRGVLNFSEWGDYDAEDMSIDKESCWEQIEAGTMPPWFYYPPHPDAFLSSKDKALLKAWLLEPIEEEEEPQEEAEQEPETDEAKPVVPASHGDDSPMAKGDDSEGEEDDSEENE